MATHAVPGCLNSRVGHLFDQRILDLHPTFALRSPEFGLLLSGQGHEEVDWPMPEHLRKSVALRVAVLANEAGWLQCVSNFFLQLALGAQPSCR